jgi:hypothetical protein
MTNNFELPTDLKEGRETSGTSNKKEEASKMGTHKKKIRKTQLVKSLKMEKHEVLVIGDSHARKCVTLLQDNLGTNYEVSSCIKLGAQMNEITKTAKEEIKFMKFEDVVVVWGGANDINRNNMKEALKYVSKLVNENKGVNIVLLVIQSNSCTIHTLKHNHFNI